MTKTKEIICLCGCGRKKLVRMADIARGWGKFFSKSCKAKYQERKTGQYKRYYTNQEKRQTTYETHEFADAHLFDNTEHDCNKD